MAWGDGEARLRQALAYAARGIPVLPLHHPVLWRSPVERSLVEVGCSCGDPGCGAVGGHPMTALGAAAATTDPRRLAWWWRRFPEANVGLATGWVFDVLDVDGPHGGDAGRWSAVAQVLGGRGPLVRTGGDGWQFYLAPTGMHGVRVRGLARLGWRGRGGWVAAPPSRHPSGGVYRWVRGLDAPLPAPPPSLRARLESRPPSPPAGAAPAGGEGRPPPTTRSRSVNANATAGPLDL
ncbi:MAG TPA: bifunctional DNA primase/polymerase [Actinomycetota bacterium]|jgi:hypothetical protein